MTVAGGDSVNLSAITTSPHVGTHADAPFHVRDGWAASHELPLSPFAGRAVVCSVDPSVELIEPSHLSSLPHRGRVERLLLRTQCSIARGAFPDHWPVLSLPALRMLFDRGLVLLGVDAPSVDARTSKTLDVHKAIFSGGAYNLENLDLQSIEDGEYELVAYPLLVGGIDAAPVRAVLRTRTEDRGSGRRAQVLRRA
jgi:arylformamidase